ncbi:MAG: glycosyltransferase 87 family protein [Propionibacteriaceae bacterium]|nr:glycosyltransferase 87 family protein [Propionibacteriaceae bacterium]
MNNALLPAFGGPTGAHARRSGVFFQPLPWAILVAAGLFTLLYLRHLPCITTDPSNPINAYIRLCYSDVMVNYSYRGWASGVHLLGATEIDQPPLLGMFITLTSWFGRLLGWRLGARPSGNPYEGLPEFFGATAVWLFAAFLLLVVCSAVLARREGRGWDAMLIAASPVVLATGLINWDLFALGLTALAVVAFESERYLEAALVVGLAASASTMPLVFAVAMMAWCLLQAKWRQLALFAGAFGVTVVLVHLPQALTSFTSVYSYYHGVINTQISYGSIWYLLLDAGAPLREFGALTFVVSLLLIGVWLARLYTSGRAPKLGQLVATMMLIMVLLAPSYPPQTALWVLFALFLARPADGVMWAFSALQLLHTAAIWGRLAGHLEPGKSGPWMLYHLTVLLRVTFEAALLTETMLGARRRGATAIRATERTPVAENC